MDQRELNPSERIDLLRDDLTDVSIWLKDKRPSESYVFAADYYHHQKFSKDIAYVVILGPTQEKRRAIRADATRTLEALGWRIRQEGGGDVIDISPFPIGHLTAHQKLRSIARVQNAIDQ